ncbi:winged helix-turn-helix domain-containing protein [Lentisalinibacter salinarum]|uniref:winged helix-turn-helix domain-containing protein n=1 Tax=Lentisalinibacter salinarum TaxID=2992239 RepID=UPI003868FDC6
MPNDGAPVRFGSYRVHPVQGLFDGREEVRVTPKSLAVLYTLAGRAGDVVTKAELFETVWPDCSVSDATLSSCIYELRQALGDNAHRPRYIETVHRRGFRFVHDCKRPARESRTSGCVDEAAHEGFDGDGKQLSREIADVARWLSESGGASRMAWVRGRDSLSNNALVHYLLRHLVAGRSWRVCIGRCRENFGSDDPYHPLIEALDDLCQGPGGASIASHLRRLAPTWLAELPSSIGEEERDVLRQVTAGVTRTRMLAELNGGLKAIAADRPLIVVIEDLQWCDTPTLQWLETLENPIAAPILFVITSVSVTSDQDRAAAVCERAREAGVATVLASNGVSGRVRAARAADRYLEAADATVRRVLEAADIVGEPFTLDAIAAVTGDSERVIRGTLGRLEDEGILRRELAGAATGERHSPAPYFLANAALREQIGKKMPASRRRELHHACAVALKAGGDATAGIRAAASAHHFERAFATELAIHASQSAAATCRRRAAHSVALRHLRRALQLIRSVPEPEFRSIREASLQASLGSTLAAVEGAGSDSVRLCHERARRLAAGSEQSPQRFSILWALWAYYMSVGPLSRAQETADELARTAETLQSRELLLDVHHARWSTALMFGDVRAVRQQTKEGLSLCGLIGEGPTVMGRGCTLHNAHTSDHNVGVCAGFFSAWGCALAGKPEDARLLIDTAVAHARAVGHPYMTIATLVMSAAASAASGDAHSTARFSAEGASIAGEHGFSLWQIWARIYAGWAETRLGSTATGLEKITDGLALLRGLPVMLFRAFQLSLAAEAQLAAGRLDDASESIRQAFEVSERFGDRLARPELYRLRGELALAGCPRAGSPNGPEADFCAARAVAREQGAELYRARALQSLRKLGSIASVSPETQRY